MKHVLLMAAVLMIATACGSARSQQNSRAATTMNAAAVAQSLKTDGLPIGAVVAYDATTDPNHLLGRPNGYTSKVAFQDSRVADSDTYDPTSIDNGGSVEVFATATQAKARMDYVQAIGGSMSVLSEYDYQKGGILLRVSHMLTPEQAQAYQDALAKLP